MSLKADLFFKKNQTQPLMTEQIKVSDSLSQQYNIIVDGLGYYMTNAYNAGQLATMRVGDDDFRSLLLNSNIFVDKSLFIKEIIQDSGYVILITRPRRWGKSLNMSMLKRFLEIEVDKYGNQLQAEHSTNLKLFVGGALDLGFGETKHLNPNIALEQIEVVFESGIEMNICKDKGWGKKGEKLMGKKSGKYYERTNILGAYCTFGV